MRPPDRSRRPADPRASAEAAFKAATTPAREPLPKPAVVPKAKEQVTLRIDADVLERFQADGPGWQDRINDALRKASGVDLDASEGLSVENLNAENDG